jgi:hypothetical protein
MAAQELDPRILRVGIEIGGNSKCMTDLAITAKGTKYANANQNDCEVTITNLAPATRDYILTEASPFRHAASVNASSSRRAASPTARLPCSSATL